MVVEEIPDSARNETRPVENQVLVLAYDAALTGLREQDNTMSNLRNRATALLAAAAVGTPFATAVGVIGSQPGKGVGFPTWAGWTLVSLVVLIGLSVMVVLWPTSRWNFGPDPAKLLASAGEDIDHVRRVATMALIQAIYANNRTIEFRVLGYRIGAAALMVETAILLFALLIN